MAEVGILQPDERVELLEGQVLLKYTNAEPRLWTVAEYYRMAEVGILHPNERVELIEGQILTKMSPQGTAHATAVTLTEKLLEKRLEAKVLVRVQLPIQLNDLSEPEPDIAVVIGDALRYGDHHPTPSEIYLIVEIADTTVKSDCETKAKSYAKSGIADYWVLDVNNRQLHVFREPTQEGYQSEAVLPENSTLSPIAFPVDMFTISEMLRPL
ncbi:Uma2 family endonuclease [Microcoleus sp. FACHB-68]|nr:Uma2 family endonuclease [Microcoleus sp. FACHB-68]